MKLGIIVRADDTGLGNQTRELVKMLNPDKILIIDSSNFHNKHHQNFEWYEGRERVVSRGLPDTRTILRFLSGLNVVISCETFYNKNFVAIARKHKVKTILQYNFEFLENFTNKRMFVPDVLMAPSLWRFDEVQERFGDSSIVIHLPPPTDERIFEKNKEINKNRSNRLLHVGGKAAIYDRNGTNSVIEMLKYSKQEYQLVIKSQSEIKIDSTDERVVVEIGNEKNNEDLYHGYDAMILPRRYAGLSLPMNEALMSGLPVFMTDISPNNFILPKEWLAKSNFVKDFMARIGIQLYNADPESLAYIVDSYFAQKNLLEDKQKAFDIGYKNFSPSQLKEKYLDLIEKIS